MEISVEYVCVCACVCFADSVISNCRTKLRRLALLLTLTVLKSAVHGCPVPIWHIYLYLVAVGDYDAGLVVWIGALPVTTTTPVTSRHTDQQPVLTATSSPHEIHG